MDKFSAMYTFTKIVETGSFTKAADQLNLPKSRVSQRLTELENELGVRLIQRTTRTLHLTEEGHAYYKEANQLLSNLEDIEAKLKKKTNSPKGNIYVECLSPIARWVLLPRLAEFHALFPDITLHLNCSDRISHIFDEGIDCAIRGGELKDTSVIARHIADIQLGLYASKDYLASKTKITDPSHLKEHRWISWFNRSNQNPFYWVLETSGTQVEISNHKGLYLSDQEIAILACKAGNGICPAAPFSVENLVKSGELIPILEDWHFPYKSIHIIYPSKKHLSLRVKKFIDWAVHILEEHQGLKMSPTILAQHLVTSTTP